MSQIIRYEAGSIVPNVLMTDRRGYPMGVEAVQSASKKGERILDAIGVPLSDARLVLLEDVVSGDDAVETIRQLTHATADMRKLPHDDRVDALAWALQTVGGAIAVDEADQFMTASIGRLDELLAMPLRHGGIRADGLEARMLEGNEEEERLVMKLDHALGVQAEELRRGKVDPSFAKYIESLQTEVAKLRRYSSPA